MRKATLLRDLCGVCDRKTSTVTAIESLMTLHERMFDDLASRPSDPLLVEAKTIGASLPQKLRDMGRLGSPSAAVVHYVRAQLFITLVAELEGLIADLMVLVIAAIPYKLRKPTLEAATLAENATKAQLVGRLAEQDINNVMYGKPEDYRARLEELLSLPKSDLEACWPIFIEIKARRDIAMHNDWAANETYMRKTGGSVRANTVLYPTKDYFAAAIVCARSLLAILRAGSSRTFVDCTKATVFREMWEAAGLRHVDFSHAWTIQSCDMVRPVAGFSWAWSGSEKPLFDFFSAIYSGSPTTVDFAQIYARWSGPTLSVIDEWLSHPFHF